MKAGLSREADAKARLAREEPKKWVFPLGSVKWKPSVSFIPLSTLPCIHRVSRMVCISCNG